MDVIEIVRGLESAGFERRQAEAIAEAVERATTGPSARLATKDDIAELRLEIAELRTELRSEIAELRTELHTQIAELRTELRSEIGGVRAELHREIGALAWKAAALLLAQAAFIIAVLKLTP